MSNIKTFFSGLGCDPEKLTYLGDAVYAGYEAECNIIWLVTERHDGMHHIGLEDAIFKKLLSYYITLGLTTLAPPKPTTVAEYRLQNKDYETIADLKKRTPK